MTRFALLLLVLLGTVAGAEAQPLNSDLAECWRADGHYFTWTSTLPENAGRSVRVFYTCVGDAARPTVLALHGFPTSSLDFRGLARDLQPDYWLCTQFLTNGNMYLPLANLTDFQKRMLDPATAPLAARSVTPGLLAVGLGQSNYTPPLKADDAEVQALAAQFTYQNGVGIIPATIQYLNERKKREVAFLETLSTSTIPATLLWGVHDMVSPVRVADYVFTTALASRRAPSAYWLMPCGHHYVQHDQPG